MVRCLLGDELPPLPAAARDAAYPTDLARYEGRYWFEQGNMAMTALIRGDKLALDVPGQTVYELLAPDHDDKWTFAMTDTIAVSFDQIGDEPVRSLTMYQMSMTFVMQREDRGSVDGLPSVDELRPHSRGGSTRTGALMAVGEVRFPFQGVVADYTLFADGPRRIREVLDLGILGETLVVIDDDHGWTRLPDGNVEPMSSNARSRAINGMIALVSGDWSTIYDELEVVDTEQDGELELFVLIGENAAGDRDELRVDRQGRLHKSRTTLDAGDLGGLEMNTTFADWREVDGVWLAHSAVAEMGMLGRVEFELAQIRTGATIDESWFDEPDALTER